MQDGEQGKERQGEGEGGEDKVTGVKDGEGNKENVNRRQGRKAKEDRSYRMRREARRGRVSVSDKDKVTRGHEKERASVERVRTENKEERQMKRGAANEEDKGRYWNSVW